MQDRVGPDDQEQAKHGCGELDGENYGVGQIAGAGARRSHEGIGAAVTENKVLRLCSRSLTAET